MSTPDTSPQPEPDIVAAEGDVRPASHYILPLIGLAVEHVFDVLGREGEFTPTILATAEDGTQGMWAIDDLVPEDAATYVAQIQPTPRTAVAVFHGEGEDVEGTRFPAVFTESFEAGEDSSVRMVFPFTLGDPDSEDGPQLDGEPTVVANGPNPIG